ncbi:hypothetical protein C9413_14340 [Rhizobium sp. SEMIA 4085]|uniref:Uncharacterized protein n=1 Tax=Rhizobium gallicum bv. gallicum R602sp TaxID=1041138 RepID=A0A0B4X1Y5_9HYPH|nr:MULTISPECIES: hypothetical protein [Rhizobium]AJD40607.1 hypothetical protein RGR602_CH01249 [Rhizobium gallicum bv. gallicum R602sp]NNH30642.1 hypothetical protein [Rhizobium sp. SEMIA 4085]TDW27766.1 hypothetical protein EV128_110129 [Rhizobium azibense]
MGVLEVAIASLIWARRTEQPRDELYGTDIGQFLGRMVVAFAVFAAVITGLQIAAARHDDPQMVADSAVAEAN